LKIIWYLIRHTKGISFFEEKEPIELSRFTEVASVFMNRLTEVVSVPVGKHRILFFGRRKKI
jgi:hypothetical protein